MKDLLIEGINRLVDLSSEEEQIILENVDFEKYPTKKILVRPGEESDWTYFVLKGILRSYTVDENGAEHVLNFAAPGWWITDMYSYFSEKPSIMYIDVVDDAEVYLLSRKKVDELYVKVPKMERFFRILTQNSLVANQQRIIDKMSLTAEERYDKFQTQFKEVKNCLPQKHIASYIGVTPEFFSKMKSKLLKQRS